MGIFSSADSAHQGTDNIVGGWEDWDFATGRASQIVNMSSQQTADATDGAIYPKHLFQACIPRSTRLILSTLV